MRYQVTHTTAYQYDGTISLCHNVARLIPRSSGNQLCLDTAISIIPQPDVMNEYEDFFGNKVLYFAIQQEHTKLTVTVSSEIEKNAAANLRFNLYSNMMWEDVISTVQEQKPEYLDARQYIPETAMTAATPEITAYALRSFTPGRSFFEAVNDIMQRIYTDFEFKPGFTTIATPLEQVMQQRKGVCQDFAHLAIACVRAAGLPARYVSGYLETIPPPGKEKLTGADASHAWFSVFIPDTGWIDFDPTNNVLPADQHLTIGWGRDYADITPLKGIIFSSGQHQLSVAVDVRRMD